MKNNARVNLKINEPEGGSLRSEHSAGPTGGIVGSTKTVDQAMEDLERNITNQSLKGVISPGATPGSFSCDRQFSEMFDSLPQRVYPRAGDQK